MSANLDSDMSILDHTTKDGTIWRWSDPPLAVDIGKLSPLQAAEQWCGIVRGEYERQEGEATAKREQAALLRRDNKGDNPRKPEPARASSGAGVHLQGVEGSLQELLEGKLERLYMSERLAREAFEEATSLKTVAGQKAQFIAQEIDAVKAAMEVSCVARQDVEQMGHDICGEIHRGGQDDGGAVGDSDSTEDPPQSSSSESEGDSEVSLTA